MNGRRSTTLSLTTIVCALAAWSAVTGRPGRSQSTADPFGGMVEEVIALLDHADVIALGESHGSRLDSDFRLALMEHPDFSRRIDVIVVEFANAHRQTVLDRFISGAEVPRSELVRVWRDTGYDAWESPIYEAFLFAVREANRALPREQRIRVIAGDMPINWDEMRSGRELLEFMDRGDYPTHIVDCEILAKGKKGLIIYGSLHLLHGPGDSFVTALDVKYPGRVRTLVGIHWPDAAVDRLRTALKLRADPELVVPRGSSVEGWDYYETHGFVGRQGPLSLGEAVDGLLYYGAAEDEVVSADPAVFDDPDYRAQRQRQMVLLEEARKIIEAEGWGGIRQYDSYTCD